MAVETITNLTIKGFKSIRDLDNFPLNRFNVLIGANGSGKSNFIDFFLMLNFMFKSTYGELQLFTALRGRAGSLLHYGPQRTASIDADITFADKAQTSTYSFTIAWGAPDELSFSSEGLIYEQSGSSEQGFNHSGFGKRESSVLEWADDPADVALQTAARAFRDRLRKIEVYHFHDTGERAPIRVTQDLDRQRLLMSDAGNLAVFLHRLKENNPVHYKRIVSTVQLVAPFIRDFVIEPEGNGNRYVLLKWRDRSGDVFGPHQLSDGTLRAIALITALLQPEETLPSIMLFDEPELGLHPAAVGLIAGLLKSASLERQVIVATQSPILIREYSPDDITIVERHEDDNGRGASQFKRLDNEALGNWINRFDLGKLYEMNVTGGGAQ